MSDPQAQQVEISETTGENRTTERIFTGFDLSVSKSNTNLPDFFKDAKSLVAGATGPKVLIERKLDNGTYTEDHRFGFNKQGKLAISAGALLDFEAEKGADGRPDGLIELKITITDADGDTAELLVNIQLTNVNEAPDGLFVLMVGVDDPETERDERTPYDPSSRDAPRLPTGTTFSIKKSFDDPDDPYDPNDPDRDNLTYTYRWVKLGVQNESPKGTGETFAPDTASGRVFPFQNGNTHRVYVTASDGELSADEDMYFRVYEKTPINRPQHTINENEAATGPLASINLDIPGGGRISGVYEIISVNGYLMNSHPLFEMNVSGSQLLLKNSLDYEVASSYKIVLRHVPSSASGTTYADVTFTLTVNNVNEAPIVAFRYQNDPTTFDFTLNSRNIIKRLAIYDPDNSQNLPPTERTSVAYRLSDDRFSLEEYTPGIINNFVPLGLIGRHYNLKIRDGASFDTNGETVNLIITAYEGENINAGLSGTLDLTITITPAASGTPSTNQERPNPPASPPVNPVSESIQWTDGRGTADQQDTHNLNKDQYGEEADAVVIQSMETHDRIMVNLPHVLVRIRYDATQGPNGQTTSHRKDILYSPHDVSLDDNVLAVVSQYSGDWNFGSLITVNGQPLSHFAPRSDGGPATLDYIIREEGALNSFGERQVVDGNSNRRDVFLFDGTPSTKAQAPLFASFDSVLGDRLLFTGPEDATIYWQVKFLPGSSSSARDYQLVFYNSAQAADNNVLAVFNLYATRSQGAEWSAGPEITDVNANMFLSVHSPTLVNIPIEHKYYLSSGSQLELNDVMQGTLFVIDYFSSISYNNREALVRSYNDVAPHYLNKTNKVPVIKNFEDGRDKIVLELDHRGDIWWREEERPKFPGDERRADEKIDVIVLYNTDSPEIDAHKIAIIEEFSGTFGHDDFIFSNGTDVDSDLIIPLVEMP
ncbi:hypothetical protein [Candidatus Puniceispirillum sp.]|uniref:hypothetical protein n=1 Tax=Candidatus Puniceispirillum sp. TaxID=2026719 RepID=UPI003F69AD9E